MKECDLQYFNLKGKRKEKNRKEISLTHRTSLWRDLLENKRSFSMKYF